MIRIKKDAKTLATRLKNPDLLVFYRENKDKYASEEDLMMAIVEKYNIGS